MGLRTFIHQGVEWTVWDVVRSLEALTSVPLPRGAQPAWLCFQSNAEKRRLIPAPGGWEQWSDARLSAALATAEPVLPTPPPVLRLPALDRLAEERETRFRATLDRARALDDRVRSAMIEGGASPLRDDDPVG